MLPNLKRTLFFCRKNEEDYLKLVYDVQDWKKNETYEIR